MNHLDATTLASTDKEESDRAFVEGLKREDFDSYETVNRFMTLSNYNKFVQQVYDKVRQLEPAVVTVHGAMENASNDDIAKHVEAFRALTKLGRITVWTDLVKVGQSDIERAKAYHKNLVHDVLSAFPETLTQVK